MHQSMTRLVFNSEKRMRGFHSPGRRWLAFFLVVASAGAAFWLLGRDIDWESRRREARRRGVEAEYNGNNELARRCYETALANNPYDWTTHLALARLLDRRLGDVTGALRHYLYTLAYTSDPSAEAEAREAVVILRMIRQGVLESPVHALEDMFLAVESGAEYAFSRRLGPGLREDLRVYWDAWNERGRGTVSYQVIDMIDEGHYDASLSVVFPNNVSMSMRLLCEKNDVWRLDLSFP